MKVSDINTNIIAQFETSLGQTIPVLPRAFLRVLAKVLAGLYVTLYKYADWIALQLFPATASLSDTTLLGSSVNPLKEWGRLIGCGDPYAAVPAELVLELTVLNPSGGETLSTGAEFVDPSTDLVYRTTGPIALDDTAVKVSARCTTSGAVGGLAAGAQLTCSDPPATLYPIAEVDSVTNSGADAEGGASYRQRVINFYQRKPTGGSYADYYRWGMRADNIADIFPYTGVIPGSVDVYVQSATLPDGLPDSTQLADVLSEIELDKPVGVLVQTFPIARREFTVQVAGLVTPTDGATVQADIITAVEQFFLSLKPYITGLSYGVRMDSFTASGVGAAVQSVASQYGAYFGTVRVYYLTDQIDAYSLEPGELAKCTSVTFV